MEAFELYHFDYIDLYKLLKIQGWVSSGAAAKECIDEGLVEVNGQVETQRRKKLREGDHVVFGDHEAMIQKENKDRDKPDNLS